MSQRLTRAQIPLEEMTITPGSACQGCGGALSTRLVFKALGPNVIRHRVAQCPDTTTMTPGMSTVFEGGGAMITGTSRGLKAIGRTDVKVVASFGDGGTYDIGFQGLSAAAERNENVIVICKDNEAYMNTGNQRSSATPKYSRTSTTPVGPKSRGKPRPKKNIPLIFAAHYVPYVATASVGFPEDLIAKVNFAKELEGFRMIIVQSPCPSWLEVRPRQDHRGRQGGRPDRYMAPLRDRGRHQLQAELQAQGAQAGHRVPAPPGQVPAHDRGRDRRGPGANDRPLGEAPQGRRGP